MIFLYVSNFRSISIFPHNKSNPIPEVYKEPERNHWEFFIWLRTMCEGFVDIAILQHLLFPTLHAIGLDCNILVSHMRSMRRMMMICYLWQPAAAYTQWWCQHWRHIPLLTQQPQNLKHSQSVLYKNSTQTMLIQWIFNWTNILHSVQIYN